MKKAQNEEWMLSSLKKLLNEDEKLECAIHGVLVFKNSFCPGFFGLTDDYMLIALPKSVGKDIQTIARIKLEIHSLEVKKSLILRQNFIIINLKNGDKYKIRAAKKVHQIPGQEESLSQFIKLLSVHSELC